MIRAMQSPKPRKKLRRFRYLSESYLASQGGLSWILRKRKSFTINILRVLWGRHYFGLKTAVFRNFIQKARAFDAYVSVSRQISLMFSN